MAPIPVVAAIIEEVDEWGNTRYLMTKRAEGKKRAGEWEFPGGRIKAGESPRQALEREVLEEIDIFVEAGEEVLTMNYIYPDGTEIDLITYRCRHVSGEINLNRKEVSDYDCILASNMHLYPILRADQFIVEQLLEETKQRAKQ